MRSDTDTLDDGRPLALQLLGAPAWRRPEMPAVPLARLDAVWLALLVLDGEQPRDRLAAWLWPEASQKNANLNLRQRVYRLRQRSGHPLVEAGALLRLAAGIECDIGDDGDWPVDGELLGGLDYGDSEALERWVQAARQRCRRRQLDQLSARAAGLEARGEWGAAIACCERLLLRSPLQEHGWRRLMRLHFLCGDRVAAIDAFERFEQQVCREQGSRPAPDTLALLARIERLDPPSTTRQSPPVIEGAGTLPAALMRPAQLIGRGAARDALAQAWQSGHAAMLIAPAGMGKSRLLDDFAGDRHGVLRLRGQPGDGQMPYALATVLLRQVMETWAPVLSETARAELARLLPDLGPPPGGAGQQRLLWHAVVSALQSARANGLQAILVDDLQLSDRASLELIRWLIAAPALTELRFAFGTRPEAAGAPAAAWRDWLDDSVRVEPVTLQPWTEAEILALLQSLGLPGLDPPSLAPALYAHAGGHPFFTLETLKGLWLAPASVPPGQALPLPATVQAMLTRRFDRLSAPARDLLRLAAVAGAPVAPHWAAKVLARPLLDLAEPWAELEAAQVVQGQGLAHALVQQAALASVPEALRRDLHRALAQAAEDEAQAPPARIAGHRVAAGEPGLAAPWWRRAAAAARRTGRLEEQQDLLDQAAIACRQAGDEAGALDAECDALPGITVRLGSEAALARVEQLRLGAGSAAALSRLALARSEALLNLARYDEAGLAADQALALADPGSDTWADALALQCRALALTGDTDAALARLARLARIIPAPSAQGTEAKTRELAVRSSMAHALAATGQVGEAMAQQALARVLARETGDAAEMAQASANLATLSYMAGETAAAWRHAVEAGQRYDAMASSDAGHGVFNRIIQGRCAAHLGHLDEALATLQAAARAPRSQVGETPATLANNALATLWLWLGEPACALDLLAEPPTQAHPLGQLGHWLVLARAAAAAGRDPEPARAQVRRLAQAHPALLDEPLPLLEWAQQVPAAQALARLRPAMARSRRQGRPAVARSLALAVLALDPGRGRPGRDMSARAARLLALVPSGLFAASYLPQAWTTLAASLPSAAAASCRSQALDWLQRQALPRLTPARHRDFIAGNPVNLALWREGGLALPPRL